MREHEWVPCGLAADMRECSRCGWAEWEPRSAAAEGMLERGWRQGAMDCDEHVASLVLGS